MASKFVRNITKTVLRGKKVEPLDTNVQNDLLSDEEDVFVRNKKGYHCITDDIKKILTNKKGVQVVNTSIKNTSLMVFNSDFIKSKNDVIKVNESEEGYSLEGKKMKLISRSKDLIVHEKSTNDFELSLNNTIISTPFNYYNIFIIGDENNEYLIQSVLLTSVNITNEEDLDFYIEMLALNEEQTGTVIKRIPLDKLVQDINLNYFLATKIISAELAEIITVQNFNITLCYNYEGEVYKFPVRIDNYTSVAGKENMINNFNKIKELCEV